MAYGISTILQQLTFVHQDVNVLEQAEARWILCLWPNGILYYSFK